MILYPIDLYSTLLKRKIGYKFGYEDEPVPGSMQAENRVQVRVQVAKMNLYPALCKRKNQVQVRVQYCVRNGSHPQTRLSSVAEIGSRIFHPC